MIFVLIFLSLFTFSGHAQQIEIEPENKLLWEISKKGAKGKSYLYGSYHSNDKRVFQFCDSVYFALDNVKAIVVETDLYAMFKDWDTRADQYPLDFDVLGNPYTRTSEPTKTSYGDENGMPQFLDLYFLQYGFNTGKDYFALESIEDQMNIVNNPVSFSNPYIPDYLNVEEKAIQHYLSGDIEALEKLMRTSLKWNPAYYDKLITKRNAIMANGIDSLLIKNTLFIAIGAGHLGGDKGVVNLLRSKGYTLRPMVASYSNEPSVVKSKVLGVKNYQYFDSITNLSAILPGKPFDIDKENVAVNLIFREMGQGNTYSIEVIEKEETQTIESVAKDYIQSPGDSKRKIGYFEDGSIFIEGISDSYPEGISWVRVIDSDRHFAILKAYGGNKFMNSKRPQNFFNNIFFIVPEDDPR